ncbi:MAG TPA: SpoIIE family protein phosphatase [Nocardioides sp.]|nr:SpoIIE family protein phosphatase [Nocardioides sp.]
MTQAARKAFLDALVDDDPVQLYDQAPCGFLSTTPDGRIVKANATLCSWLGTTPDALCSGRSFADLLTRGGQVYHETHYAPMLRMHDRVRELALEMRRVDGRRLPVLVNATMVRDAAGEPVVIRIAVFDATERRRYERELVAAKELAESSEAEALKLARTLQQTLIPATEPVVPGLELATAYRPATHGLLVGGDFYDVFAISPDDWAVVVGDVCGKGADAAVITALARWTLRGASVAYDAPSQAIANLNEVLRSHESERFCTAAVVRLRRSGSSWRAQVCVAGHPAPYVLRTDGESGPMVATGPLVGIFEDAEFTDHELELGPGTGLLLFTDGVTEAGSAGAFFDDRGIAAAISTHGTQPQLLVEGLVHDVAVFQEGDPRDDIAVLALRTPLEG